MCSWIPKKRNVEVSTLCIGHKMPIIQPANAAPSSDAVKGWLQTSTKMNIFCAASVVEGILPFIPNWYWLNLFSQKLFCFTIYQRKVVQHFWGQCLKTENSIHIYQHINWVLSLRIVSAIHLSALEALLWVLCLCFYLFPRQKETIWCRLSSLSVIPTTIHLQIGE